jgi:tetratricopeptide (TPR) repeat protein
MLRPDRRVDLEALIEVALRFFFAPLLQMADAAIEEGQGVLRIDDDRLVVIVHRSRQIAVRAARIALISPKLALLYCNRGVTRKSLGDLKWAIADYTEAIRLNPDFNLAYFNRSAALRAMGKGFEAEQDFIRRMATGKEPEASLEPPIEGVPATKATDRKIQ